MIYVRRNKLLDKIISRLPNSCQLALPITNSLKCNGSPLFFLPECKIHAPLQNRVARHKLTNKKGDANTKSLVKMRICFYWKKKKRKRKRKDLKRKGVFVCTAVLCQTIRSPIENCALQPAMTIVATRCDRRYYDEKHLTSLSILPSVSRG